MNCLSLEPKDAKIAGQIAGQLKLLGEPVEIRDILIAAIAIRNNMTVVTRNLRHFKRIAKINNKLIVEKW